MQYGKQQISKIISEETVGRDSKSIEYVIGGWSKGMMFFNEFLLKLCNFMSIVILVSSNKISVM